MLHIHFGAGSFGLGFALWLAQRAGLQSILLNRSPRKPTKSWVRGSDDPDVSFRNLLQDFEAKKERDGLLRRNKWYLVDFLDEVNRAPDEINIQAFFYYDRPAEAKKLFDTVASAACDVFVTTAVKSPAAARDLCQYIETLAAIIKPKKVFVAAFENGFRTADIERHLHAHPVNVICLDAVVDRICSRNYVAGQGGDSPVVKVEAESYARLVIAKDDRADALYGELLHSGQDRIRVTQHVHVYRAVKLGWMNAAHILLAGDAQFHDMPAIHEYLSDREVIGGPSYKERLEHLNQILSELREGLIGYWTPELKTKEERELLGELISNTERQKLVSRFIQVEDDVHRVLSRLKAPTAEELHTMSDFLRSMLDKIAPPVLGYLKAEQKGPLHVTRSFMRIAELIAERKFITPTPTIQ